MLAQKQRDMQALLARHQKFWDLEEVDRPLLVVPVDVYAPTKRFCSTLVGDVLEPDAVDALLSHLGLPARAEPVASARDPGWSEAA